MKDYDFSHRVHDKGREELRYLSKHIGHCVALTPEYGGGDFEGNLSSCIHCVGDEESSKHGQGCDYFLVIWFTNKLEVF